MCVFVFFEKCFTARPLVNEPEFTFDCRGKRGGSWEHEGVRLNSQRKGSFWFWSGCLGMFGVCCSKYGHVTGLAE